MISSRRSVHAHFRKKKTWKLVRPKLDQLDRLLRPWTKYTNFCEHQGFVQLLAKVNKTKSTWWLLINQMVAGRASHILENYPNNLSITFCYTKSELSHFFGLQQATTRFFGWGERCTAKLRQVSLSLSLQPCSYKLVCIISSWPLSPWQLSQMLRL